VAGEEEVKITPNPPSPGSGGQAAQENSSFIPHPSSFRGILWHVVAILIGGLFIYAGVVKALDPVTFARDIGNYQMLPWQIGVWLALYLPWLEIFCGVALMTRILDRGGVFILTTLMALFIVATLIAKARGLDVSCGCFGHATKSLSFAWHLVLDFLLLAALILLSLRQRVFSARAANPIRP
jgi:putative oxidoreductase